MQTRVSTSSNSLSSSPMERAKSFNSEPLVQRGQSDVSPGADIRSQGGRTNRLRGGKAIPSTTAGAMLGGKQKVTASVLGAVKKPSWSGHLLNAARADDTDGSLAEMKDAYCVKKSSKHDFIHSQTFETAADLLADGKGRVRSEQYGIFGHSRSLVYDTTGGASHYLPFAARRIGGFSLGAVGAHLNQLIDKGAHKITLYNCESGESAGVRSSANKQSRHLETDLLPNELWEKIQACSTGCEITISETDFSTLDWLSLKVIAHYYVNTCELGTSKKSKHGPRTIKIKALVGMGFFHPTAQTDGKLKFRSFDGAHYHEFSQLVDAEKKCRGYGKSAKVKSRAREARRVQSSFDTFEKAYVSNKSGCYSHSNRINLKLFEPDQLRFYLEPQDAQNFGDFLRAFHRES